MNVDSKETRRFSHGRDPQDQYVIGSPPREYTELASLQKSPAEIHKSYDGSGNSGSFQIRLISGSANKTLAKNIASALGITLDPCRVATFADGELDIHIEKNVRGEDVFLIITIAPNQINHHLLELFLLIHTLGLSSAKRITAVVPYYPYARQDRKTMPRVPISAAAVAQLIEAMKPHRLVTLDLHSGQIQGFFHQTPVDNLLPEKEMLRYFETKNFCKENVAIVSPDAGGVYRAKQTADAYGAASVATILKRKIEGKVEMQLVGDVKGYICIVIDDIIDTGATIVFAAKILKENGAKHVIAFATHGVFSSNALQTIQESQLDEVCVTDSLPQEENLKQCKKLRVSSIVNLLAEAIERLHLEKSLSALFKLM